MKFTNRQILGVFVLQLMRVFCITQHQNRKFLRLGNRFYFESAN